MKTVDYIMPARLFYNHSYTSSVNFDTHKMKSFVALFALVAVVVADVSHLHQHGPEADAQIVQQNVEVNPDSYAFSYGTSNGISGQESGALKNVGREDEALQVQGESAYTAPDGTPIQIRYVADENGYRPEGAHLPTPPPPQDIPDYILKSIAYNAAHAKPEPEYRRN